MSKLTFIPSNRFRELVESESKKASEKGKKFIKNPEGFARHLINTGRNGELTARRIYRKQESLGNQLEPRVLRVAGLTYDIGKIGVGDSYHEIPGAYSIIKEGERWSLIAGASKADRQRILRRIASCLPGDWALLEELGNNFPESALYLSFITPELEEQVEFLRRELSPTRAPLTIKELTALNTLEKQIALYADMVDNVASTKEGRMSVTARLQDIKVRYRQYADEAETPESREYYMNQVRLAREIAPRIIGVCDKVEELL